MSLLLIFAGGWLSFIGGGLIALFINLSMRQGELGVPNFENSKELLWGLYGLFGLILAGGLSVIAAGIWQVIFLRAHRGLISIFVAIVAILITIALIIRVLAGVLDL